MTIEQTLRNRWKAYGFPDSQIEDLISFISSAPTLGKQWLLQDASAKPTNTNQNKKGHPHVIKRPNQQ